jgi:methyl-accepting chemotaxis protein-1 (serine sensor receptor)
LAAHEIKRLIEHNVQNVGMGTQLADQTGATMTEVVAAIEQVSALMVDIATATAQQHAGLAQVGEAILQMDQSTQQNAALVEQSTSAADSLRAQALQLTQSASVFKLPSDEVVVFTESESDEATQIGNVISVD